MNNNPINVSAFDSDVARVCNATNKWYSEDLTIYLYADGNWNDIPEQRDILVNKARVFAKKWQFVNEIQEPYEDEFLIYDSQTLDSKQLPAFINDAQEIMDYAWNLNASVDIKAHFVPEDGQKEKALNLGLDDKCKITVECISNEK